MILVDTTIIIDFWRNPTEAMREIFLREDLAICGITKAELIHGAKTNKDISMISSALSAFKYLPIDESIWKDVGVLLYQLRKKGITVPFQDVVLCALSLRNDLLLWTKDRHFSLIRSEIKQLMLYEAEV